MIGRGDRQIESGLAYESGREGKRIGETEVSRLGNADSSGEWGRTRVTVPIDRIASSELARDRVQRTVEQKGDQC